MFRQLLGRFLWVKKVSNHEKNISAVKIQTKKKKSLPERELEAVCFSSISTVSET